MNLELLLVPYDTARRGWRSGAGPEHLHSSGLISHLEQRGHAVLGTRLIETEPDEVPAEIGTTFGLVRRLAVAVRQACDAGHFPLVLSGNCNAAVGTLSGLAPTRRAVFWFDAHGDLNTPDTTGSGFLDGMGLSMAFGMGWRTLTASIPGFQPVRPDETFMFGVRDLDAGESAFVAETEITLVGTSDVPARVTELLDRAQLADAIAYVHLDPDVFDPVAVGRGNSLPVPDGLTVEQVRSTIEAIRARLPLGAATIASYAPEYDTDARVRAALFATIDAILDHA